MRRLAALLFGIAFCLSFVPASRAEAEEDAEYDGYLVSCPTASLQESGALPLRGAVRLEHVAGDVYWTPSESVADYLLESGRADYIEPNYVATL
ncbi:MAG: hypothetical protein IJU66_06075, partial [Oscillospiraceae bacterium]|nr:hypothetical protein [Oscillospiraceae bacterium]